MVKKGLMVQLWRIQQSQTIISLFFWGLTLAGVFYLDYFHDHLVSLGILRREDVFAGTLLLFLAIILSFLLIGVIYDRVLKLWREQTDVIVERNPYAKERLMPKEIVLWKRGYVSVMKEVAKRDSSIQKDIEFIERWIEKSMADHKELRDGVKDLEDWVAN